METIFIHEIKKSKKFDKALLEDDYSENLPFLCQFPKEFRRNWIRQLDFRFLIILAATFLCDVCILLLLLSWIKGRENMFNANVIQKRYANLLLDRFNETQVSNFDEKVTGTYLDGVPEDREPTKTTVKYQSNLGLNSGRGTPNGAAESSKSRSGSVNNNFVSNNKGQGRFGQSLGGQGTGSSDWIGSQGIFQYIITGDNTGGNKELNEIFAQGDRNARILEGSLANVKFAKYHQPGEISESGEVSSSAYGGLKGSKSTVSRGEVQSSLTPLEKVEFSAVAKNTELEEVTSSVLEKTGNKAYVRQADYVTRVVIAHNRSIQDCFKQTLKRQPDLKGKVVVRFSVTPEGWVDQVVILQTTIDDAPLLNCVVNRIRRWRDFGESDPSLGTVSYRQTYVFGY